MTIESDGTVVPLVVDDNIVVPALLAHRLMLPPLDWQNRIATVKQKLDRARSIEGEEIGKFLPALLDRAFSADTAHQQAA